MAILLFFLIIIVLVTVHELGHFIAAKRAGIRVDEFGIGFPPRAKTLFVRDGTKYTLNWLPFGGFVKIYGENPEEVGEEDKKVALVSKSKLVQAWVLFAGVFFNIILAWVLFSVAFMNGVPASERDYPSETLQNTELLILDVVPRSAAALAGIEAGDVIREVKGKDIVLDGVITPEALQEIVKNSDGAPLDIVVDHKGTERSVSVLPSIVGEGKEAILGISMDRVGTIHYGFFRAFEKGAVRTVGSLKETAVGLGTLLRDAVLGKADLDSVAGPVGLVGVVGQAYSFGLSDLLYLIAIISINLAIINLIPFPALDGGRLFFLLIEAIKRSPIKPNIAGIINTIGLVLLILLMLVVTYHDITKLVVN